MARRLVLLLVFAVGVAGIVSMAGDGPARANHPEPDDDPNFNWVYELTMYDFYPSNDWPNNGNAPFGDHDLRYRVCVTYGPEADYAAWDWTTHRFGFNPQSTLTATREPDCGSSNSDALFYVAGDTYVTQQCGSSTYAGCFKARSWLPYDSYFGRHEVYTTEIIVRQSWMQSHNQAWRIHLFEHELGHGFGLAHHPTTCTVMAESELTQPSCNYWVNTPDILTARCVYIYAC